MPNRSPKPLNRQLTPGSIRDDLNALARDMRDPNSELNQSYRRPKHYFIGDAWVEEKDVPTQVEAYFRSGSFLSR